MSTALRPARIPLRSEVARPTGATRPRSAVPAPSTPGARRHLHLVDGDAARRERRTRLLVRGAALLVVVTVLVVVAFHAVIAEGQVRLERLTRETAAEQRRYELRRAEVAARSAPEAIVARATQLGMVPSDGVRSVGVPAWAARAAAAARSTGAPADWEKVKPSLAAQP